MRLIKAAFYGLELADAWEHDYALFCGKMAYINNGIPGCYFYWATEPFFEADYVVGGVGNFIGFSYQEYKRDPEGVGSNIYVGSFSHLLADAVGPVCDSEF